MTLVHAQPRRIRADEYYRMAETGIFGREERVELIDGTIVSMSPQNPAHATSIRLTNMILTDLFRATHLVSCQAPLSLGDDCEPEPDFALVTPEHLRACAGKHPSRPDLVLEISDSSLRYDKQEKVGLYARAGIPEYWVLDLKSRRLEVHQDPGPEPDGAFGHSYRRRQTLHESDRVAPQFAPQIFLSVGDLLPQVEP